MLNRVLQVAPVTLSPSQNALPAMTQHILGLLLMTYLFGFSITYWQRLRQSIQMRHTTQIKDSQDTLPLTWQQGLGMVLVPIPRSLLWFMGKRSDASAP